MKPKQTQKEFNKIYGSKLRTLISENRDYIRFGTWAMVRACSGVMYGKIINVVFGMKIFAAFLQDLLKLLEANLR